VAVSLSILARRALLEILGEFFEGNYLKKSIALSTDESGRDDPYVRPSVLTILSIIPRDDHSVVPPHVDRGLITLFASRRSYGLEVSMPDSEPKAWQSVEEPGHLVLLASHLLSHTTRGVVSASAWLPMAPGSP
jgi:hypothetical protein